MATNKIFIPYYISNNTGAPAQVLPRVFFYNGLKESDPYWIQHWTTSSFGKTVIAQQYESFPYFDNYSGQETTTSSLSLLFLNEDVAYGDSAPSQSLYDLYWAKYVDLLYNPRTRIIRLSAVLPFPVYQKLELNDIIQLRSNYYHLRAINDYNLKTGECRMELLGPLLEGALNLFPRYYSTQINANVQRDNCTVGYTGSFTNVVLAASYSVSTASQAEAQSIAQTYFNSISQSEANASGSCILDTTYYATYSLRIGNQYDNNVTTSLYPLTVSFYTTTSINVPSESSPQWLVVGYIDSSSNQTNESSSFTVTGRKNFDLNNPFSSSQASGSLYNLYKVRGNGGEKLVNSGNGYFEVSSTFSDIAPNFYQQAKFEWNTGSAATESVDLISAPKLYNNYTQSIVKSGDFYISITNGTTSSNYITGSVAGPLTMSWLVTSSISYPSTTDPKFSVFGLLSQSYSSDQILVTVNGSQQYVNAPVYGTSSLYTTSGQVYFIKFEDGAGLPVYWYNGGFVTATNKDITVTIGNNATPGNIMRLRVTATGSVSSEQGVSINCRNTSS